MGLAENRWSRRFIIALIMLSLLGGGSSYAQAVTTLSIPAVEMAVGDTITVDIVLDCAAESCSAFDIELAFNPAVARVDLVETGSFFSEPVFTANNTIDNQIGSVRLAATVVGNSATTGRGTLVRLTMTGLAEGSSLLYVQELGLTDFYGNAIHVIEINNVVTVTAVAAPAIISPSPSPTATESAAPPSPASGATTEGVLFLEDFEGESQGFELPGFEVQQESDGNHVYCGRATSTAASGLIPDSRGENYSLEARMRIAERTEGNWWVQLRGRADLAWASGYGFQVDSDGAELFVVNGFQRSPLHTRDAEFQDDTWYRLRLDIDEHIVGGYVDNDGVRRIRSTVPTGAAAIRARNVDVCFDDIALRTVRAAAAAVAARSTPTPLSVGSGAGLFGEYYRGISGGPRILAFTRIDPDIRFDWNEGSPISGISDYFSVQWRGQIVPPYTASYTFSVEADDGIRLFIDNELIIDHWEDQEGQRRVGRIDMVAGRHYDIRLEYYERTGNARVRLEWSSSYFLRQVIPSTHLYPAEAPLPTPTPTPTLTTTPTAYPTGSGTGLLGEYHRGIVFRQIVTSRVDGEVNFDWGSGGPVDGLDDNFLVRWTGQIEPLYTGLHRFYVTSDDGIRLYVDDELLIDHWQVQNRAMNRGEIQLVAGRRYDIRLEYFERTDAAMIRLEWANPYLSRQIIPREQLYPAEVIEPTVRPTATPRPTAYPTGNGTGLLGEYYRNFGFRQLVTSRVDGEIIFDWGSQGPVQGLVDNFTVRWTGQIVPLYTGPHRFLVTSDDGVRLYVDDELIIDRWQEQNRATNRGDIELVAGRRYDIRLEYFERTDEANIRLDWSNPYLLRQVIPREQLYPAEAVTPTPRPTATPRPTTTPIAASVIVNVPSGNLRSGPGTDFALVGSASNGTSFTAVARTQNGEWYQVRLSDGGTAWLSSGIINVTGNTGMLDVVSMGSPTPSGTTVVVTIVTGSDGTNDEPTLHLQDGFMGNTLVAFPLNQPNDLRAGQTNTYVFTVPYDFCTLRGFAIRKPGTDSWFISSIDVSIDGQLVFNDYSGYDSQDVTGGGWEETRTYQSRCN